MLLIPSDVTVTPRDAGTLAVDPIWADVDRPNVGGWVVKDRKTADRLERALRAGVVFSKTEVKTDNGGLTYVATTARVMGRYMNADLKKLGF